MDKALKVKCFYKKHNLILNCLILLCLVFLSLWVPYLNIITLLLCVFFTLLDLNNGLSYLAFLLPFKNIYQIGNMDLLTINIGMYFVLILIKFFKGKRFKDKQNILTIVVAVAFLLYAILPRQTFGVWETIRLGVIVAILVISFIFRGNIKFKNLVKMFFCAIILSSILGLFRDQISRLGELIDVNFPVGKFNRFCGLELDPNYYGSLLIVAFCGMLYLHLNKDVNKYVIPICAGLITYFGIATLSKSCFLALAMVIVLWAIDLFIKPSKDKFICFGLSIAVVSVVCLINIERVKALWGRFSVTVEDSNYGGGNETSRTVVESLTTGRTGIWKMYFQYFKENPLRFLFGTGTSPNELTLLPRESHNTFIQIIYKIGLIGLLFYLVVFILFMCYYIKKKKLKFYHCIPGIMLVGEVLFLDYFSLVTFAFLIVVALTPIVESDKTEDKKEEVKIDEQIEESKNIDNNSGL